MTNNVNINIDEDMAERLVPFILESTSDNVLEDLKDFVGVLSSGLTISGFEKSKLLIGQGIGYLASRIGWYCLEHLDDFLSIVQDEKLREGFESALMFLNEEANSLAHKKTK